MKKLAQRIAQDLQSGQISAIYNSELARLWPPSLTETERQKRIRRFAKSHGFNVTFYNVGLCAVFEAGTPKKTRRKPSDSN
jgi:hypothetical protein